MDFHSLSFFHIIEDNGILHVLEKASIYTEREPPAQYKLDGLVPACNAYYTFINFMIMDDDDLSSKLEQWNGGLVAVMHDDVLAIPDLNGIYNINSDILQKQTLIQTVAVLLDAKVPAQQEVWSKIGYEIVSM